MPEGPEVKTIGDWLRGELVGKTIQAIEYTDNSRYAKTGLANHDQLDELLPLEITEIETKGKKIIFLLQGEDKEAFLISSLMMEGRWNWEPGNHGDLWLVIGDDKLYFHDSRHFGTLDILLTREDLLDRLADLGPDLLSDQITLKEYKDKIKSLVTNKRRKPKKVGIFVMEQEHFCGIGNYLRAEILYDARISPHRFINDLTDQEIERLFNSSRRLILESYRSQGATLATYQNPHGGKGEFKVIIYNKDKDPHGHQVIKEDIGDKRTTHWVPEVQL